MVLFVCETWFLTLREGPEEMRYEVAGGLR
jgi:hypothetical protein